VAAGIPFMEETEEKLSKMADIQIQTSETISDSAECNV